MSRRIVEASVVEQMLRQRGIKVPKAKVCCGRTYAATPIKYVSYLKQLGFSGDIAIRSNGIITELCHI